MPAAMHGIHVSRCPTSAKASPRSRSSSGTSGRATRSSRTRSLADVMTDKATVEIPSPVSGTRARARRKGRRQACGRRRADPARNGGRRARPRQPCLRPRRVLRLQSPPRSRLAAPAKRRRRLRRARPQPRRLPRSINRSRRRPFATTPASCRSSCRRVRGSGPGGRIEHDDLVRHAARRRRKVRARGRATPSATTRKKSPSSACAARSRRRCSEALRIPHFTYVEEIDVTELEALRAQLNDEHGSERGRSRCCRS